MFTNSFSIIICLYVDKKYLTSRFNMKDLNEVDTIIDNKVEKPSRRYVYVNLIALRKYLASISIWA